MMRGTATASMATEGWGAASARGKIHYIRDHTAICGRLPLDRVPFIDASLTTANGTHDWCKRCMKLTGTTPHIIIEFGVRATPAGRW